jgi:hypothetical protein
MSAYLGEAQLLGWSESHNSGAKMTLALPDPSDLNAFRLMTVRKGKHAGQLLACLIVEMQDDEDCLSALQRALTSGVPSKMPAAEPVGGPLAQLAGKWCKSPDFQTWIDSLDRKLCKDLAVPGPPSEEKAREIICDICVVESRKELDTNDAAKERFNTIIREPYRAYLSANA